MRKLILLPLLVLFTLSAYAKLPVALFTPVQGAQAFKSMYSIIAGAREYAHVTVYSWSDSGFDKALASAVRNGAKVRVVLHKPLAAKESMQKRYLKLEKMGVVIKVAPMNMHEKFVVVDNKYFVNSSANMSTGARTKYSESFIFGDNSSNENIVLLKDFINEFTILWNSSTDLITHNEGVTSKALNTLTKGANNPVNSTMALYSSSMNFTYKALNKNTKRYQLGARYQMFRRKNSGGKTQTSIVTDMMIRNIRAAKKNIYANLNHIFLKSVTNELIKAMNRGVKLFMTVDNQEYKSRPGRGAQTATIVAAFKKKYPNQAIPVRVLYYSHNPSPRYWYLNHNKTLLIDYGTNNTRLITGSHNISVTAEHNQFDNMVLFQGNHLTPLYTAFYKDFMRLWTQKRTHKDEPTKSIWDSYLTPNSKGQYILHSKYPMSLRWEEVDTLRYRVNKAAPGIFRGGFTKRDCYYYSPKTSSYSACAN